ncbi:UNVERIFIED_CONTAM: hypothetical protein Cloal_0288 [Acetivibrio alkalicellulosi]
MSKKRNKIFISIIVSLLFSTLLANVGFTSSITPRIGIIPLNYHSVFYYDRHDLNGTTEVKTIYTQNNNLSFSLVQGSIDPDRTTVNISKASSFTSSTYSPVERADVNFWSSGNQFGSSKTYCRINLPGEGKYRVSVLAFPTERNAGATRQVFNIVYSNYICNQKISVVDEARFFAPTTRSISVHATVHDLSGNGITKEDVRLTLYNVEIMTISQGRASAYLADDITITKHQTQDIYYISGTVDASFYNNRPGEYCFGLRVKGINWGSMVGTLHLP